MVSFRSASLLLLVTLLACTSTRMPIQAQAAAAKQYGTPQQILSQEVPATCPVTKPSGQHFVPPSPYTSELSKGYFWFGTNQLWTTLPVDGTWKNLPYLRQRMHWWRQGYDWRTEHQPKLTLTGKRLDSAAPPLRAGRANPAGAGRQELPFMTIGMNFPAPGCWEIQGRYQDDEVTFVVWVP